jgi:hypothetical protein
MMPMSSQAGPPACPVCGRGDQTQPVQAIVAQQVTQTAVEGTTFGVGWVGTQAIPVTATHRSFATARSPLAQMLDLPYPPRPRNLAGCGTVLIAVMLLPLLVVGRLMAESGAAGDSSPWTMTLAYLTLFSPGIILGIALILIHGRDQRDWREQVARWERALPVWMTLRYCHRDHVVYQPPDVSFPPAETRQFVYRTVT